MPRQNTHTAEFASYAAPIPIRVHWTLSNPPLENIISVHPPSPQCLAALQSASTSIFPRHQRRAFFASCTANLTNHLLSYCTTFFTTCSSWCVVVQTVPGHLPQVDMWFWKYNQTHNLRVQPYPNDSPLSTRSIVSPSRRAASSLRATTDR